MFEMRVKKAKRLQLYACASTEARLPYENSVDYTLGHILVAYIRLFTIHLVTISQTLE